MAMNITQDKAYRWTTYGLVVIVVLVGAYAVMQSLDAEETRASAAQARSDAEKMGQDAGAARKKLQDQLNARTAEVEAKQREVDNYKALFAKLEPDVVPILEVAAAAKTAKPEVRAAALAGVGLIGQIAHGANNDAALGTLMRALAVDKANCVAGLAANLGGAKSVEVAAECQAILPKPAAAASPAATTAPAATPAKAAPAEAGKAAGKN